MNSSFLSVHHPSPKTQEIHLRSTTKVLPLQCHGRNEKDFFFFSLAESESSTRSEISTLLSPPLPSFCDDGGMRDSLREIYPLLLLLCWQAVIETQEPALGTGGVSSLPDSGFPKSRGRKESAAGEEGSPSFFFFSVLPRRIKVLQKNFTLA